jgi:hypothetical protein
MIFLRNPERAKSEAMRRWTADCDRIACLASAAAGRRHLPQIGATKRPAPRCIDDPLVWRLGVSSQVRRSGGKG